VAAGGNLFYGLDSSIAREQGMIEIVHRGTDVAREEKEWIADLRSGGAFLHGKR
jgi:hypothetical protein